MYSKCKTAFSHKGKDFALRHKFMVHMILLWLSKITDGPISGWHEVIGTEKRGAQKLIPSKTFDKDELEENKVAFG